MKLDIQWIKRLRAAWLHPVSEQIALQSSFTAMDRSRPSTIGSRANSRSSIRPSIPSVRRPSKLDRPTDEATLTTSQNYSHQKFIDWRLFLNKTSVPQFQLYVLPVRV